MSRLPTKDDLRNEIAELRQQNKALVAALEAAVEWGSTVPVEPEWQKQAKAALKAAKS